MNNRRSSQPGGGADRRRGGGESKEDSALTCSDEKDATAGSGEGGGCNGRHKGEDSEQRESPEVPQCVHAVAPCRRCATRAKLDLLILIRSSNSPIPRSDFGVMA